MKSLLTEKLPETVRINGRKYPINTDFRAAIRFEITVQSDMPSAKKVRRAIELFFGMCPPPQPDALLIDAIAKFYSGYSDADDRPSGGNRKRYYSYAQDAGYIYAAFMEQYGIDLTAVGYMHWYKFIALFRGLTEDTEIVKIMGYRAVDLKKIHSKYEKERLRKLQEAYRLRDDSVKRFVSAAERSKAMRDKVLADMERVKREAMKRGGRTC